MVPRQAGYFGKPFEARRGVRVGDTMSPTIFNIMVDAVIHNWKHEHRPDDIEELALFFADDGMMTGTTQERVQASLDIITQGFTSLGLIMNARKTKFMVMKGGEHRLRLSTAAYSRKVTHEGTTYRAKQREKVQCLKCGAIVGRSYLKRHQIAKTCLTASKTYAPPTPVRARVAAEQQISHQSLNHSGIPVVYQGSMTGRSCVQ